MACQMLWKDDFDETQVDEGDYDVRFKIYFIIIPNILLPCSN